MTQSDSIAQTTSSDMDDVPVSPSVEPQAADAQPVNDASYPTPLYAWYTVGLLLVIFTFSFIDRMILGLLGPAIKEDFGITDSQFGLLTGFGFALFYTMFGLVCARIADTGNRKWLITIGLILWSLMTAAGGWARNYMHLFLLRIGVGVGEATLGPAANSIIADSFPKHKLATALSVYTMGIPIGAGLAYAIGGALIELSASIPDISLPGAGTMTGWQKTFVIVGLPGLLLAIFSARLKEPTRKGLKEPTRKGVKEGGKAVPVREVLGHLWAHKRAFAGIMLGVSVNAALGFGMMIWMAFFMDRYHGVPASEVGIVFGMISIVMGPLGLFLAGYFADKWAAKGHKAASLKTLIIGPIGYTVPFVLFTQVDNVMMAWALISFANIFLASPSGVALAALQMITPNQMRGQVIAFYGVVTTIFGYSGGAYLFGFISDSLDSLRMAYLLFGIFAGPLCVAFYTWAYKPYLKARAEV